MWSTRTRAQHLLIPQTNSTTRTRPHTRPMLPRSVWAETPNFQAQLSTPWTPFRQLNPQIIKNKSTQTIDFCHQIRALPNSTRFQAPTEPPCPTPPVTRVSRRQRTEHVIVIVCTWTHDRPTPQRPHSRFSPSTTILPHSRSGRIDSFQHVRHDPIPPHPIRQARCGGLLLLDRRR